MCEPTFLDELEDSLLSSLLQDECELKLFDLEEKKKADDVNIVKLLDIRFTMGSHIDRERNVNEHIQPFKLSPNGLV